MKVIIVGGGRMGSGLTKQLGKEGHVVTLIDRNEEVLEELSKEVSFHGINGIGFDKEVLESAGVQEADALVSCTSSDESNALVGRIAKNIYRVPRVIARLFDPEKANIYNTLGIETISTTSWGIARASERITYSELGAILSIGNNEIEIVRVDVDAMLAGRMVDEINVLGEIRVIAIHRSNKAFMPTNGSILQAHDTMYISVVMTSLARLKTMLGLK
jgi:trk system potassium uptake protein TrkA